jgi:phosphoenolpyruvate-protein phosphotransferase/dihydroxyacetone kinase phosphotransfer subunit
MIGFVIVSHSARLAEGVCELAAQMAQGKVRLAPAGGASDADNPIGTDAFRVLQAIESVYSEDGVLVLMDLGSAVLSAETALELLPDDKRAHVQLCSGPVVERAVEGACLAAAGASVEEILRGSSREAAEGPEESIEVTLADPLGLHARPAARVVRTARRFQAHATVGGADAGSINSLLALRARHGDRVRICAKGAEARKAVQAVATALESHPHASHASAGLAGSAGIAIGPVVKVRAAAGLVEPGIVEDLAAENERLLAAIRRAQTETRALYDWAATHAGVNEAGIFDAQLLFLEDPDLARRASRMILEERCNAEFAWQTAAGGLAAADAPDLAARVLRILAPAATVAPKLTEPSILVAHDLTPSAVKDLDPHLTLGLCLETGSASAHSVILARAMGIPAVVGLGPAISALADGTTIALDGARGAVWISPSPTEAADLERRRKEWLESRRAAQAVRHKQASTRDGRPIRVLANISGVAEAAEALDSGAEGIGVLRTEFLFLGRNSPPDEDEQFEVYRAIAETLGQRQLVIRTLDIGGDKPLPYVDAGEEANPFLGWRGIRLTLARLDLLEPQLRAIVRASPGHRIEILLPMLSTLNELRQVKKILGEVNLPVGVMIEVPAAVAIADQLAREAAFFSIGTNDLVQYVMAADRTNARVAPLADPLQPAVLRALRQAIEAGRRAGIPVTLCGELAADTLATPLLLGMGLEEFSVSAPLIPELKRAISRWSLAEAQKVAERALEMDSCEGVRRYLASL